MHGRERSTVEIEIDACGWEGPAQGRDECARMRRGREKGEVCARNKDTRGGRLRMRGCTDQKKKDADSRGREDLWTWENLRGVEGGRCKDKEEGHSRVRRRTDRREGSRRMQEKNEQKWMDLKEGLKRTTCITDKEMDTRGCREGEGCAARIPGQRAGSAKTDVQTTRW